MKSMDKCAESMCKSAKNVKCIMLITSILQEVRAANGEHALLISY